LNEILVDTDVVSYLLNRHSLAEEYEKLLIGYVPMVSFITVAEMYRGAYKKNWGSRRMAELGAHLRQFAVVPSSLQVCLSYAEISNAAEARGSPLPMRLSQRAPTRYASLLSLIIGAISNTLKG
jgi:predicted nucleic acid-binding protein